LWAGGGGQCNQARKTCDNVLTLRRALAISTARTPRAAGGVTSYLAEMAAPQHYKAPPQRIEQERGGVVRRQYLNHQWRNQHDAFACFK